VNVRAGYSDAMLPETIRRLWQPSGVYIDTASYGLPALPTVRALQRDVERWRDGSAHWPDLNDAVHRARLAFASLVRVQADRVTVGANVSSMLGLVASCIPDGSRVVAPDIDFASTIYPFLAQADRKVDVRTVPLERLADSVDASTDLVVFSAVQSANGQIAATDDIVAAARTHDALTVCDTTHAIGWLPVPLDDLDVTATAAYKWLTCPRGAAFMTTKPEHLDWIRPHGAGWFAKRDIYDDNYYGPNMDLATDARRLDTSPAWLLWGAVETALQTLSDIGVEEIHTHDLELANRCRAGLGLPPGDSAIVHLDVPEADIPLAEAGIVAGVRAGKVRASFHVHNSIEDVEAVVAALTR
jgi:selenocysteine lyase/cysteine desulfurase